MAKKEGRPLEFFKHRVITLLDRNELDFLDKISKDALFSTGHRLPYGEILRTLVDFALERHISGNKLNAPEDLKEEMLKAIRLEVEKSLGKTQNQDKTS